MGFYEENEAPMAELVEDPAFFKKFTLIRPDVSRGSDAIRLNPLR
jgi:hypothetical protein